MKSKYKYTSSIVLALMIVILMVLSQLFSTRVNSLQEIHSQAAREFISPSETSSVNLGYPEGGDVREMDDHMFRDGGHKTPYMYDYWKMTFPEKMPEWIAYCAKHGVASIPSSSWHNRSYYIKHHHHNNNDDDDEDDDYYAEVYTTFNRMGQPYDRIPQDVAYALTYQYKGIENPGSFTTAQMQDIQRVIWSSWQWASNQSEEGKKSESSKAIQQSEDILSKTDRAIYTEDDGDPDGNPDRTEADVNVNWDNIKIDLANQMVAESIKSDWQKTVTDSREIPARSEQFANFQYLIGNESLKNENHVTDIKIKAVLPKPSNDVPGNNVENYDNNDLKTYVDQEAKTVTVGPYKLGLFNTTGNSDLEITDKLTRDNTMKLSDLLRNEVLGKNPHQTKDNTFLAGEFGIDASYLKDNSQTTVNSGNDVESEISYGKVDWNTDNKYNGKTGKFVLLNENMEAYPEGEQFPELGKEFYIKYPINDANKTLVTIKPFLNINYLNSLNATTALYAATGTNYTVNMTEGSSDIVTKNAEALKAAGLVKPSEETYKNWMFYSGEGFGDHQTLKLGNEMIELNWDKFFSNQEYAQKIMHAVYNSTINTINRYNDEGKTVQNKFEEAKFGIYFDRSGDGKDNSENQLVTFDDIKDISKIPTLTLDDVEDPSSQSGFTSKMIVPTLHNVNKQENMRLNHVYLCNYNRGLYIDYSTNKRTGNLRDVEGIKYLTSGNTTNRLYMDDKAMADRWVNDLTKTFFKKSAKLAVYFDDETARLSGRIRIKDDHSSQPATIPSPLKLPKRPWENEEQTPPEKETETWRTSKPGTRTKWIPKKDYHVDFAKMEATLPFKYLTLNLGGNVWQVVQEGKESRKFKLDPSMPEYEKLKHNVQGVQVNLFDLTADTGSLSTDPNAVGKLVATTLTDANGNYGFQLLNPMHKYYVTFTLNGMQFMKTDLGTNVVSDDEVNRNTADELSKYDVVGNDPSINDIKKTGRQDENDRFMTISAGNKSYQSPRGGEAKAYGYYSKLRDTNDNYIAYQSHIDDDVKLNSGALRYADALYEMHQAAIQDRNNFDMSNAQTMYQTYTPVGSFALNYSAIKPKFLARDGINKSAEGEQTWGYMMDTMVTSRNQHAYPESNQFIVEDLGQADQNGHNHTQDEDRRTIDGKEYRALYRKDYDFARNVDYGIESRVSTDLYLQKDLSSARVIVNGTDTKYRYGGKQNVDYADITISDGLKTSADQLYNRINDPLYNGKESYSRQIRKSEYLYDAKKIYTNDPSSADKNLQVYVTYRIAVKNYGETAVNVDEITDYYDSNYLEHDMNNPYVKEGTYFIARDADDRGRNPQDGQTAITSNSSMAHDVKNELRVQEGSAYKPLYISGMGEVKPSETKFAYITFKLQNDETGRIKLNQDIESGNLKIGVKNIAEINQYTSTENTDGTRGIVDINSIPGSISERDFDSQGNIITSENPVDNRLENDTDKSPNVVIYVPVNDNNQKVVKGYVFEDQRTETSNDAVIGNGVYNTDKDKDKKIDGVTVQLVELVKDVDKKGQWKGNYLGEHVWSSKYYPVVKQGDHFVVDDNNVADDATRYYSGKVVANANGQNVVQSKVMISGDQSSKLLYVPPVTLDEDGGKGAYAFSSIVSGDYFVRYVYGDTTQTVLVNDANTDVNKLVNNVPASQSGAVDVNSIVMNNDNKYVTSQNGNDGFVTTSNDKVLGLNDKSYNGQDYKSTVYQKGIQQDPSAANRLGIREFVDYDNQNYSENGQISAGINKDVMYYYNIAKGDTQKGISDAKDISAIRQYVNAYSNGQTQNSKSVRNELNEVLRSFEKIATNTFTDQANANNWDGNKQREQQINMLKELMANTKMVAQSGVIDMETEYNKNEVDNQAKKENRFNTWKGGNGQYDLDRLPKDIASDSELHNTVEDLDLGLVERPEAQLKLTKNVSNFKLVLANGTTMFDANQSVNNLYFGKHEGHTAEYDDKHVGEFNLNPKGLRLTNVHVNQKNAKNTPELVQGYMDDELMDGSNVEVTYDLAVENVGEVDYLDNQFYYTGVTKDKSDNNKSKTSAKTIVDYVTNSFKFDKASQNSDGQKWTVRTQNDLMPSLTNNNYKDDLVNRYYKDEVAGYTTLLTTDGLSDELVPIANNKKGKTSATGSLKLSTLVSSTKNANDLVYNNLSEIVETVNSQGRRMQYSINGNQRMADQTAGANAVTEVDNNDNRYNQFTPVDLVNISEIDADSAQKVVLLPPTGENRNYASVVIPVVVGLSLVMVVVVTLSVRALRKRDNS